MFERLVQVKYLPCKDCFGYLPGGLAGFQSLKFVKLGYGDGRTAYLSANTSMTSLPKDCIGIGRIYAKALGLQDNDTVVLQEVHRPPTVKSLSITPTCESDYEVLALMSQNVQSTLLDQVSVVHSGQHLVIWIGRNIYVKAPVADVWPVSPGRLTNLTEIVVKPVSQSAQDPAIKHGSTPVATADAVSTDDFIHFISGGRQRSKMDKFTGLRGDLVVRVAPGGPQATKPFDVFLGRHAAPPNWASNDSVICQMKLLTSDIFPPKPLYVRLCLLDDHSDPNLGISTAIFDHFNCQLGARVVLTPTADPPDIQEIHVCTRKNFLIDVKQLFREYVGREGPLILNPEVPWELQGHKLMLKFTPVDAPFCLADGNCKLSVLEDVLRVKERQDDPKTDYLMSIGGFQGIVDALQANPMETLLVTGKSGTGKTAIARILREKLAAPPLHLHCETVECKKIKGKTLDSLRKLFENCFALLVLHQPSVLVLDDLQVLCEAVPGDEPTPQSVYFNRIGELLHNLLTVLVSRNRIGVVATATSPRKLNGNLYASRGTHLFRRVVSLEDPSKEDRREFLKHSMGKYNVDGVDFGELTGKTEGFALHDLGQFVNKAVYEAYKDDTTGTSKFPTITRQHCLKALETTNMLSLHDVRIHAPGTKDFSDVGGLADVKKTLVESLLWPAQFPTIFAGAPLRLQSGLLLYGPPGTGKTVLAAAAAKHCGLRLISIKGPELLSKYIGASEQAVRDVFDKAQSAKPCVLFFDEFDSLAPRRGQDTTGVTDRVVNQLLTQLDGVETLTGVCVLGATSRPDLLDPALLRPGRFDKQLLCPLPDRAAREEILRALSKGLNLSTDVDLKMVAEKTENFSGADLQSILCTAQMSSIEHLLITDGEQQGTVDINRRHVQEALQKTRPSLTAQERQKYEKIYARFQGGHVDDFKAGSKATLA